MRWQPWRGRWGRWLAALFLAVTTTGVWYALAHDRTARGSQPPAFAGGKSSALSVEVVSPRQGGIDRLCVQPGSVEPFQAADLYTKVSGFLVEQSVDIGSAVKAGEVLAKIAVPEYEKQVKQDAADVTRAEARVDQMKAAITTAEADVGAASAAVALAQAEKRSKVSNREFRAKQRDRIANLALRGSLERKLADEQEDQYQAAVSAETAAGEAIRAARQKEASTRARIKQAEADLRYAEAEVNSARARLEKSEVLLGYTVITSPYTGVVTKRNFHPGDFVRSADAGGERIPVLAVERTDVMRVVVQVPERDVPFVDLGDQAVVEVDALPGLVFKTKGDEKVEVSRLAASEDPQTRMMRTEVHVKNPAGKLRRGMFGHVTLILQVGTPGAVRVPSAALTGKADRGEGTVRVVRDGKVSLVRVRYGADNGSEVEVLSGLNPEDRVVWASGPLEEGTAVEVAEARPSGARH